MGGVARKYAGAVERPRPVERLISGDTGQRQESTWLRLAFRVVASKQPEQGQRRHEPVPVADHAMLVRPVERQPHVVVLRVEPVEPRHLLWTLEMLRGSLDQLEVPRLVLR